MNPKVEAKLAFFQQVPLAEHPARQRCFMGAITALIQAKNVQLPQVAKHFNDQRSPQANERRLQAFLTEFPFDYHKIALLMTLFIPRGRITLCLDRTDGAACAVEVWPSRSQHPDADSPLWRGSYSALLGIARQS